MSDDLLGSVESWLEKSGRAFELRVARSFRRSGARQVQQSFAYTDPEQSTLREGDVLARFPWTGIDDVPCSITAVVECKSSKKDPWVAFYDQSFARASRLEDLVYCAHAPSTLITDPLASLWVGSDPFSFDSVASHVVAAHTSETHNPASNAVRQCMSACEAQRLEYIKTQHDDKRGLIVLPVVVTSAPLVRCRLDDDGAIQLEEVGSFVVWGHGPEDKHRKVFVLTEERVSWFSASLADLAGRAHEEVRFRRSV